MKPQHEAKIDEASVQTLITLGLSRDEARCYVLCLSQGSLSAGKLASRMDIYANAVYRIMDRLEKKGFVVSLDTHPATFQAIPTDIAISSYINRRQQELEEIKTRSLYQFARQDHPVQTQVDIQTGKNQMFATYVSLAKKAKKEICMISLGEPVSDEIKLANRDAIERGVKLQFIFHRYTVQNRELLKSYVRMGIEAKHLLGGGFHLQIFDRKVCVLTANNPKNTEERTSMVIYNEGIASVLRDYFTSVWEKAARIQE